MTPTKGPLVAIPAPVAPHKDFPLRRSRGQGMVEFALILPLLIVLIFAIIDFSYYLFVEISVNNAVRAGVRRASMNNLTRAQIEGVIKANAAGVDLSTATFTITTRAADSALPGSPPSVEITCTKQHRLFAPITTTFSSLQVKSSFRTIIVTYTGKTSITF